MSIDAMKQALEALEPYARQVVEKGDDYETAKCDPKVDTAITGLRLAIEQAEAKQHSNFRGNSKVILQAEKQEPVCDKDPQGCWNVRCQLGKVCKNAAPPQRQPQSTTDMMMDLADRLGELPSDVDPRAWEHLLVYAPRQKKPEPVAMRYDFDGYGYKYIDSGSGSNWQTRHKGAEPLYSAPPQRQPLTDEEIATIDDDETIETMHDFARAIERKHGIGGGE